MKQMAENPSIENPLRNPVVRIRTSLPRAILRCILRFFAESKLARFTVAVFFLFLAAGCGGGGSRTFTVNSNGDEGDSSPGDSFCRTGTSLTNCTLRAALEEANMMPGQDTINFQILLNSGDPGGSVTIRPASPLPRIYDDVYINGSTQPGFGEDLIVTLDGSLLADPGAVGLSVTQDVEATIQALQVKNFILSGLENQGSINLETVFSRSNGYGFVSVGIGSTAAAWIANSEFSDNEQTGIQGVATNFQLFTIAVFGNRGCGISIGRTSVFSLNDSQIYENSDENRLCNGAGISLDGEYTASSPARMHDVSVTDNTAANPNTTGGVYYSAEGPLTITESRIRSNTASGTGDNTGGLYAREGVVNVIDSDIRLNKGHLSGGVYSWHGEVHLTRSSVLLNRGREAGGISISGEDAAGLWLEGGSKVGGIHEGNIADFDGDGSGLGGGIYSLQDVHVSGATIEGNTGDGVYLQDADLVMEDSAVRGNTGSGVYSTGPSAESGTPSEIQITRGQILENQKTGVYVSGGNLIMDHSTVDSNTGGGIQLFSGVLTLARSTISRNSGDEIAGGVAVFLGEGQIIDTTISDNHAHMPAGGVQAALGETGRLSFKNVTLSGNAAMHDAGAVYVESGSVDFNNVTIAGNVSLYAVSTTPQTGSAVFANTVFSENTAANCGGFKPVVSNGFNLDDDGSCGFSSAGDLSGVPANLGPLQDNGGETFTRALLPGSPALEAGNDATCLATDQRGVTRPQGLHCDMGAFEAESPATATPPSATATPTPAPTPTGTPTPAAALITFGPVKFSTDILYAYGRSCDPKELIVQVKVAPADLVYSLGLFYRLEEKSGGKFGPWSAGLSMVPQGGGWYTLTIYGEDMIGGFQSNNEIWVAIQFVANGKDGQVLARSQVYRQVTLGKCYQ